MPYLIIVTILVHGVKSKTLDLAYKLCFSVAMANSCMNPVIYAWKNQDFKIAFQELLSCCKNKQGQAQDAADRGSRRESNFHFGRTSASTSRVSIVELSSTERF
jgi:hypothetical protein